MNLKEHFKQRLLNRLFEQNDDIDYDAEIEGERQRIAKRTNALLKAQSQSDVSGLNPLNDRMPYKGGPADYYTKSIDYPPKSVPQIAKALRHPMSASAKMSDPLGLKTLTRAAGINKAFKSMSGTGGDTYPFTSSDENQQGEYDSIAKSHDRVRDLETSKYFSDTHKKNKNLGPR